VEKSRNSSSDDLADLGRGNAGPYMSLLRLFFADVFVPDGGPFDDKFLEQVNALLRF
jgi:hypothetical protein